MRQENKRLPPTLWEVLSMVGGIAALSNVFKDIVQWQGIFKDAHSLYYDYINLPIQLFFEEYLFQMHPMAIDYLVIGMTYAAGHVRSMQKRSILAEVTAAQNQADDIPESIMLIFWPIYFVAAVVLWPWFFFQDVRVVYQQTKRPAQNEVDIEIGHSVIRTWFWFGGAFAGFVVLAGVNAV